MNWLPVAAGLALMIALIVLGDIYRAGAPAIGPAELDDDEGDDRD